LIKDIIKVSVVKGCSAARGAADGRTDGASAEEIGAWGGGKKVTGDIRFVKVGVGKTKSRWIRLKE
jgi:hypothetical protein